MAGPIVISILANASKANATLDQTTSRTQKVGNGFRKMALPAVAALGAITAAGNKAASAAADDARGQTVLAAALRRSAGARKADIASTEAWIDKTARATGVADDQLRPALGTLVRGTKDVAAAQKALNLALDISALTGKDVNTVATALGKGYAGNTGAIGKLNLGLDKATLKSGNMEKITAKLAKTSGGTMAKAANTEAGKMQRAEVARDEAVETIGARLLPLYEKAATALAKFSNYAAKNEKQVTIAAAAVAALATAVLVVNGAMKVAAATTAVWTAVTKASAAAQKAAAAASIGTRIGLAALAVQTVVTSAATKTAAAAQWVLNAALTANPIGLIITAVVALVAGLVLFFTKTKLGQQIWNTVWNGIKTTTAAVIGFVKPLILGAVQAIATYVRVYLTIAKAVFTAAWTVIKTVVRVGVAYVKTYVRGVLFVATIFRNAFNTARSAVVGGVSRIVTAARALPGKIKSGIGNVKHLLLNVGRNIIDGLISGITGAGGRLMSAITRVVNKIPKKVRKLLGINSPAKKLVPSGVAIPEGIGLGVERGLPYIERALATAARSITRYDLPTTGLGLDAKGKALVIEAQPLEPARSSRPTVVNFNIKVDASWTDAQRGAEVKKWLDAARSQGLIVGSVS